MIDLENYCEQVAAICKDAGSYIRQEYQVFSNQNIEQKGFHDLVSYVDKEAERFLVEKLQALIPESGFITEEDANREISSTYNWIIDPLDGTTNFIHKVPTFSVSVALINGSELLIGVVYEINRDECFTAYKGGGAYLNGNRIQVSNAEKLSQTLLATGFPFRKFDNLDNYLAVLKSMMQQTRGIRRIGSAAADLAYTACGRFDCFFEYNLNDYDIAAGVLLIQEAGGKVYDFYGRQNMLSEGSIIGGNPLITEIVFEEVKKHFK